MTTEMFGAPFGISAAEDQINQNTLASVKALQTLGEIRMQPAEMQLKQAQVSLANAQARLHIAQAGTLEEAAGANAYLRAHPELMQDGSILGQTGTNTAPENPQAKLSRIANSYLDASSALGKAGFIPQAEAMANKTAQMVQHIAAAGNSAAEQEYRKVRTEREVIMQDASDAAAVNDPTSYINYLQALTAKGRPISEFPPIYDDVAKRVLAQKIAQGMTANETRKAQQADINSQQLGPLREARRVAALASANASNARVPMLRLRADKLRKELGPGDAQAKEAKDLSMASKRLGNQKTLDALYPNLLAAEIADLKLRVVNKTYKTPSGYMTWMGPITKWIPDKKAEGMSNAAGYTPPKGTVADTGDGGDETLDMGED